MDWDDDDDCDCEMDDEDSFGEEVAKGATVEVVKDGILTGLKWLVSIVT